MDKQVPFFDDLEADLVTGPTLVPPGTLESILVLLPEVCLRAKYTKKD